MAPPAWEPETWIDEGPVRSAAQGAVARGANESRPRRPRRVSIPREVTDELQEAVGARRAERLEQRLAEARVAFERERYQDARRILTPLAAEAPRASAVRELLGLTLYRLDRWKAAAAELEAYRTLTGATDQHPVLADCYRALRRYASVDELWAELKAASPSAALVAEGRIVAAGALADRGRLREAIDLLERSLEQPVKVREHHLRQWYALADLYDRAGELPRARGLFGRIAHQDPRFADVADRLAALGR